MIKVGLSPSKKNLCYLLHWKPFKNDEKYFYFILKAFFVLQIFKFLSWLFGHVGKTAWLETKLTAKFMESQPVNEQWQYTYWPISHEVWSMKATRKWNLFK